jgi:DNA-binding SARP family transcriptional activator
VNKENRTSLHLPVPKAIALHDGFTLDFEINIRDEKQNFGYIFRMISRKNNTSVDLVISDFRSKKKSNLLSLIIGDEIILAFKKTEVADFKFDTWNRVSVSFSKNVISMVVNDVRKEYTGDYNNIRNFDIYFGANDHPALFTTETPPMILRHIRLFNKENKAIRYWPLDKHGNNIARDEYKNEIAFARNPQWELDNHLIWKKQTEFEFAPYPQFAFDDEQERIFIVGGNKMIIYHIPSNQLDTVLNIQGSAFNNRSNHLLYHHHSLISYNLLPDLSNNKLTEFDFQSKKWNNDDNTEQLPYFWHHSKVFIPEDSLLVTIGGYGFHQYEGLMIKYAFPDKKWTESNIAKVLSPRYLGSIGYWGDGKLLYFGGYGSESGNQEEHPRNFYDLYAIDPKTDSVTQLWDMELPVDREHFTNSNSMIIDKKNNSFYLLTYSNKLDNTYIQAKKFSLSHPQYTLVGDTILYTFSDNKSYCNLFFAPKSNLLIAVTAYTKENTTGNVNIYSINYPPLSRSDVFQVEPPKHFPFYGYFLVLLLLLLFFLFYRKKRKGRIKEQPFIFSHNEITPVDVNRNFSLAETQASSVNLLGGFSVIDDDGTDITAHFTPIPLQIFLLCLLSSLKNGKGLTSQELREILWYDKDDDSARNNRNVNISKLRVTMKNIKNFEINKEKDYWIVALDKNVFCDYRNVLSLIKKIESERPIQKDLLNEMIRIASKGSLLPSIQMECLDTYKSDYSNLIIEKLFHFIGEEEIKKDFGLVVKITNIILLHDNIDEEAIAKKCFALYHSGKKGQAKHSFTKFTEDYKNILGTAYKYTFEQFREMFIV